MTPEQLAAAAEEAARRARAAASASARDPMEGAFAEQLAFIRDPSPFKAARCTRRAAKSYSFGLECFEDSKRYPRANYLFLGLVRDEARRVFWKDVLKDIDERYSQGVRFNESRLEATLPNGATIYIGAADATKEEMRKLLGQKYRKIAIDEAQDWIHTDLNTLVFSILSPTTADLLGSISLLGTPGRVNRGLFFDVTEKNAPGGAVGRLKGWSVHKWTTFDNPYMRGQWTARIADLKERFPGIEETPDFRRNYLNEWVLDESNLVYRYRFGRNDFDGALPKVGPTGVDLAPERWHYVLGVDLGYSDDTAFVPEAWHEHLPSRLFILEAYKEKGMDVTMVADKIREYQRARPIETVVIDGSNKQAVAEMTNRHGLSLTPADKTGKSDFIELMNGEWIAGNIALDPNRCLPLTQEYGGLVWRQRREKANGELPSNVDKREEHPACPNHGADAALYAWRYCYQFSAHAQPAQPREGSREWADRRQREMFERTMREIENRKSEESERFGPVDVEADWGVGEGRLW